MRFDISRLQRGSVAFAHDIIMAALSFALALYLRLGDDLIYFADDLLLEGTIVFTVTAGGVFWFMGLYKGVWRYASLSDLFAILRSATLTVLIFLLIMFVWTRLEGLPRSIIFINWFVLMALLGGPRFVYRWLKDRRIDLSRGGDGHRRIPVLLAGADDGAELFIRSLTHAGGENYHVVVIVSERQSRVGLQIHDIEVMGTLDQIPEAVKQLTARGWRPERLVLTRDDMGGAQVRQLVDAAAETGMTIARMPRLTDFRTNVSDGFELRPIAVEDLLGRPQTALDRTAMRKLIAGQRVMVTGAGGSIGSELVRQISDLEPASVLLLDNGEFNLYAIDLELAERHPALPRKAILADVRDARRIAAVIGADAPQLVFHAAALKHVPLVEANPLEGVHTNILGTVNVADACVQTGVEVMVLISTDKAVNPTSIMGAAKRVAERYCQTLDVTPATDGRQTRFVTVRFGNVLGSTGSVVPLFQKQLARGGPLTVTHPDMKRYFMTTGEAVQLVLQASALGTQGSGNEGKIYVLDMGEPVRIIDLARQMIRLSGHQPDEDIKIEITGARPGEKLSEEPLHAGEPLLPTDRDGILLAAPRGADPDPAVLPAAIGDLLEAVAAEDPEQALAVIRQLVPEYAPTVDAPSPAAG